MNNARCGALNPDTRTPCVRPPGHDGPHDFAARTPEPAGTSSEAGTDSTPEAAGTPPERIGQGVKMIAVFDVVDDSGRSARELRDELPWVLDRRAGDLSIEDVTVYDSIRDFDLDRIEGADHFARGQFAAPEGTPPEAGANGTPAPAGTPSARVAGSFTAHSGMHDGEVSVQRTTDETDEYVEIRHPAWDTVVLHVAIDSGAIVAYDDAALADPKVTTSPYPAGGTRVVLASTATGTPDPAGKRISDVLDVGQDRAVWIGDDVVQALGDAGYTMAAKRVATLAGEIESTLRACAVHALLASRD